MDYNIVDWNNALDIAAGIAEPSRRTKNWISDRRKQLRLRWIHNLSRANLYDIIQAAHWFDSEITDTTAIFAIIKSCNLLSDRICNYIEDDLSRNNDFHSAVVLSTNKLDNDQVIPWSGRTRRSYISSIIKTFLRKIKNHSVTTTCLTKKIATIIWYFKFYGKGDAGTVCFPPNIDPLDDRKILSKIIIHTISAFIHRDPRALRFVRPIDNRYIHAFTASVQVQAIFDEDETDYNNVVRASAAQAGRRIQQQAHVTH